MNNFPYLKDNNPECPNCRQRQSRLFRRGTVNLKDFFENTPYRITESNNGFYGDIYQCINCDLRFIERSDLGDALKKYYANQPLDVIYIKDEEGRRKTFRQILKNIKCLNPGMKNLLDMGCGPGFFLAEAKKAGLDTWGLEISSESIKFAKEKLGLTHFFYNEKELEEATSRSFDAITAFDFIEHALDPRETFLKARAKLNQGGIFTFTVPMIDSLTARFLGKKWHAIIPSHLNYFTFKSLDNIYQPLGYSLVSKRWHKRYLSLSYLLKRLFKKPDWNLPKILDFTLPINLFDEAEIYLRKN